MNFNRRVVTSQDLQSGQVMRSVSLNPSLKAAAQDDNTKELLRKLVLVLGEGFALHVVAACSDKHRLAQVLERVDVACDLFSREFEGNADIDLQLTMAVLVIKTLYPFNVKKIQSRAIEVRKFLRDFTGWDSEFRQHVEYCLITEKHLENRATVYLFSYAA